MNADIPNRPFDRRKQSEVISVGTLPNIRSFKSASISVHQRFASLCLSPLVISLLIAALTLPTSGAAQAEQDRTVIDRPTGAGPRFSKPIETWFEIGLNVKSSGASSGLTGTVPVPIDWPEQQVFTVRENRSDNVRNISFRDLTKEIRQMVFKVNRIGAGETANATVVVKAMRSNILPPEEPEKLQFAKRIPSRVRQYLKPSPFIESKHKRIREIAAELESEATGSAFEQVEQIYRWVRENVEYRFDEKIHSCIDALDSGYGDCEELSSLFIAICRARGIPARAVWIPSHTYPEFFLVDEAGEGHWLPCQAAGSYEFGAMTETRPILQKGDRFRVPGNRKPLRYVQPTLVAKDSSGGLAIEFVAREISDPDELNQLSMDSSER